MSAVPGCWVSGWMLVSLSGVQVLTCCGVGLRVAQRHAEPERRRELEGPRAAGDDRRRRVLRQGELPAVPVARALVVRVVERRGLVIPDVDALAEDGLGIRYLGARMRAADTHLALVERSCRAVGRRPVPRGGH